MIIHPRSTKPLLFFFSFSSFLAFNSYTLIRVAQRRNVGLMFNNFMRAAQRQLLQEVEWSSGVLPSRRVLQDSFPSLQGIIEVINLSVLLLMVKHPLTELSLQILGPIFELLLTSSLLFGEVTIKPSFHLFLEGYFKAFLCNLIKDILDFLNMGLEMLHDQIMAESVSSVFEVKLVHFSSEVLLEVSVNESPMPIVGDQNGKGGDNTQVLMSLVVLVPDGCMPPCSVSCKVYSSHIS
mmetsp:Transcript_10691/g.11077  ORF Transcript_10691/g.11077 Transcript_10691/m.11077 type:complete len:237 (-) Transcript_10691:1-711(-)